MIAPRLVARPSKQRLLIMLPIIAASIAGFSLVPLTIYLTGLPLEVIDTSAPLMAAIVGFQYALNTRPSSVWHLILLTLTVFAMTVICYLIYVLIHLAIAPEGDAAGIAWLGLMVLSIGVGVGGAAGTWFLVARLTRRESLWENPGGDGADGNSEEEPPTA